MGLLRKLAMSCKNSYGVEVGKNMLEKWLIAQEWLLLYAYVLR